MNAQEHYLEAERRLGLHHPAHEPAGPAGNTNIARAQVHAILALAPATARANGSPLDETRESPILDRWLHEASAPSGFAITAFAVSFGAPSWFGALSEVGSSRTAGTPPATTHPRAVKRVYLRIACSGLRVTKR